MEAGEMIESHSVERFFRSTESCFLLSLDVNRRLSGFIYGIFPLFSVNLDLIENIVSGPLLVSGIYIVCPHKKIGESSNRYQEVTQKKADYSNRHSLDILPQHSQLNHAISLHNIKKLNIPLLGCSYCRYRWFEHSASLYLMIHSDLSKLLDMITSHSRKWKDSTRVILPKLSLLQGVLDGYQISMNPVQFMYTVAHCGVWHPAALTSFSQHWNDMGISRLRSAVDTASSAIVKSLQMRAIPIVTNILLRCR